LLELEVDFVADIALNAVDLICVVRSGSNAGVRDASRWNGLSYYSAQMQKREGP
jgi:hypothetical protein